MSSAAGSSDYAVTKDNYVPLFSGAPSDYREWRKRITLYMAKMKLLKREAEGVLNLISSLTGTAWKLVETFPLEDVEKSDAFSKILKQLDKAFEYDSRVQLPGYSMTAEFNFLETSISTSVASNVMVVRRCWTIALSMTSSTTGWPTTRSPCPVRCRGGICCAALD